MNNELCSWDWYNSHIAKGSARRAPQMQPLHCCCTPRALLVVGSAAQEVGKMALGLAKSCNVSWRKERKDRPQRMGFYDHTTSSDLCLLISRLGWFEPVETTPGLHVRLMIPPEAQHHSTPF